MFHSQSIGIDLGTANTVVYVSGQGIVLRVPSVVARKKHNHHIVAIGQEAAAMVGKTPESIETIRPIKEGVIADYEATVALLDEVLQQTVGKRWMKPHVLICVPTGVTAVERRAVVTAVQQSGARSVYVLEEPFAAAVGAGLPVQEPTGSMIVSLGGGTTDVATLSLGGIVNSNVLKMGGHHLDDAIVSYLKQHHRLSIGDVTAEQIKIGIGTADVQRAAAYDNMTLRGQDCETGLPKTISLAASDVAQAIAPMVEKMVDVIRNVLEQAPPEIASDIITRGIVLTGGGALLRDLPTRLAAALQVPVMVAEQALDCVALGAGQSLPYMKKANATYQE